VKTFLEPLVRAVLAALTPHRRSQLSALLEHDRGGPTP